MSFNYPDNPFMEGTAITVSTRAASPLFPVHSENGRKEDHDAAEMNGPEGSMVAEYGSDSMHSSTSESSDNYTIPCPANGQTFNSAVALGMADKETLYADSDNDEDGDDHNGEEDQGGQGEGDATGVASSKSLVGFFSDGVTDVWTGHRDETYYAGQRQVDNGVIPPIASRIEARPRRATERCEPLSATLPAKMGNSIVNAEKGTNHHDQRNLITERGKRIVLVTILMVGTSIALALAIYLPLQAITIVPALVVAIMIAIAVL